jgi:hypothetical protein
MRKFIIERNLPGIGAAETEALKDAIRKSNVALRALAPDIQWIQSYVAQDKLFCVYLAEDDAIIRRHSEASGFPADKITEITTLIDPMTAES